MSIQTEVKVKNLALKVKELEARILQLENSGNPPASVVAAVRTISLKDKSWKSAS